MALLYRAGTVIWAKMVLDKQRTNPKNRRVLVVDDFHDTDEEAYCVAITGTFSYPLPRTSIPLPYSSSQATRCKSGLTKESVADCTWLVVVHKTEIIERAGHVNDSYMLQVRSNLP